MWDAYAKTYPDEAAGWTFNPISTGDGEDTAVQQLRMELSAGSGVPDIMQFTSGSIPEFINDNVFADVTADTKDLVGNLLPSALTAITFNNKVIAFPLQVNEKLWFYRTDLFAQAGIDPTTITTQDQFIAAGTQLHDALPNSYIWNIGSSPQHYVLGQITSGNGAQYSTESPCAITVGTDAPTAQAFEAIKAIKNAGIVAPIDDFTPEWQQGLADGTIASTLIAAWMPQFLIQYAPDLAGKWGVTTWPEIGGAVGGSESGAALMLVNANSPNKAEAISFLSKMLMTTQGATAYYAALPSWLPLVTDVFNSDAVLNNPYLGSSFHDAFLKAAPDFKVFPYDPSAMKERDVMVAQLTDYLASSDTSPTKYLQAAQQQLDSQVGCPYTT